MTKYAIVWNTADFRGDHAADVAVIVDTIDGETVEHLIARTIAIPNSYVPGEFQSITIKLVKCSAAERETAAALRETTEAKT